MGRLTVRSPVPLGCRGNHASGRRGCRNFTTLSTMIKFIFFSVSLQLYAFFSLLIFFFSLCLVFFHFAVHLSNLKNCGSYMLFATTTVSILIFIRSYILFLILAKCLMSFDKDCQLFHDCVTTSSILSYSFDTTGL